jgi:hypothetical protein
MAMSTHRDDERSFASREDDRVEVAAGVPTDRVRWGPILAGVFAALTTLMVLNTLGVAIGLSAYDPGRDDPRRFAFGAGIWSIVSLLASFAFGAWLTARSSAVRGGDNGLLNGFLVAGVGIPLLMFVLGSASVLMTLATATAAAAATDGGRMSRSDMAGDAQTASATIAGDQVGTAHSSANAPSTRPAEEARKAASRTAWGSLFGLILAIGAACAAGYAGGKDDDYDRGPRRRGRRRGPYGDAGATGSTTTGTGSGPTV